MNNTGQDFVKKIGGFGIIFFLALFAFFLFWCFTAKPDNPIEGYEPPHDSEYYAQNAGTLAELQSELEETVLPKLEGIISDRLDNGVIVILIEEDCYIESRSVILKYYDETLFRFERSEQK